MRSVLVRRSEGIYCSVRTDPRTQFPHTDGICSYILEYSNGLRCVGIDDTWTGPAKEGCPADIRIQWRIEGTNGLAIGDIGWCKEPYTSPSTLRYAAKGDKEFHEPRWTESWFPDAFIGTMAQLLIALETGKEPAISGRDNLRTMALVEAAYVSAREKIKVALEDITRVHSSASSAPGINVFPADQPSSPLPRTSRLTATLSGWLSGLLSSPGPAVNPRTISRRGRSKRFRWPGKPSVQSQFRRNGHLLLSGRGPRHGGQRPPENRSGSRNDRMEVELVGFGPDRNDREHPYPRVKSPALALKQKREIPTLEPTHLARLAGGRRRVAARVLKKNLNVDIEHTRREIPSETGPRY